MDEDIRYAWCHYVNDVKDLARTSQSVHVRIGFDRRGREIEMLGHWDEASSAWFVLHAMRPRGALLRVSGLEGKHAY